MQQQEQIRGQLQKQSEAYENLEKVMKDNINTRLRVVRPFVRKVGDALDEIHSNLPS